MSTRYRFDAGRVHPEIEIDGRLLVLCALAVASLRVAFNAAIDLDPNSVFWRGLGGLVRGIAPLLPVVVLLWQYRVLDKGYACMAAIVASAFGYSGFWMLSRMAEVGGSFAIFGELSVRLLFGGALQFLATWLLIRGLVAWKSGAWETRVWTTRKLAWPTLPLRDLRLGVVLGSVLAWVYAGALWFTYWIGFAAAGLGILGVATLVDARAQRRRSEEIPVDLDLPLDEQRLAVCRQLGVDPCPTGPEDALVVGRALWYRDSLTMARVNTPEGPRWVVIGLDALWDRRFWLMSPPQFDLVRPDLSPFLDLPVGWVVTTSPAEARFDPDSCNRAAWAVNRGRIHQLGQDFVDRLAPVIVMQES